MIEIKLTAESWPEMIGQLLGIAHSVNHTFPPEAPVPDYNAMISTLGANEATLAEARKKPGRKKAVTLPAKSPTQGMEEELGASPEPEVVPGPGNRQEDVANGAEASPETEEEQIDRIQDAAIAAIKQDLVEQPTVPPKELLELKEKVIDLLQAEYRKGRVDLVRDFLVKYGKNVKSFRQIDINDFPDMDKAIREGALA